MRVFAVPSGTPSRPDLLGRAAAVDGEHDGPRLLRGSPRRRATTRDASTRLAASSPVPSAWPSAPNVDCSSRSSWSSSVGVLRRPRTASMATLRVIVSSHAATEPRAAVVGRRGPPRPQERLLGDVVGHPGVAGDREGEPEHLRLEAPHEGRRRVGVLDRQPGHERVVGELGVVRTRHALYYGPRARRDCGAMQSRAAGRSYLLSS